MLTLRWTMDAQGCLIVTVVRSQTRLRPLRLDAPLARQTRPPRNNRTSVQRGEKPTEDQYYRWVSSTY